MPPRVSASADTAHHRRRAGAPGRVVPSELTSDAVVGAAPRSASDALRDEVFRAAAAHSAPVEGEVAGDARAEAAS